MSEATPRIAVIIPCYRVTGQIKQVIESIPDSVSDIICVDDACPDRSGDFIEQNLQDPRIIVLRHDANQGVGAAVIAGYREALERGATVAVKIDGDGQMDPAMLPRFVKPILDGRCDYAKGNRFFYPEAVMSMPLVRLIGNACLSILSKVSTGYWNIFDSTNGYTAVHCRVMAQLPLARIDTRYFFESDMLYHLGLARAVVRDIPMRAVYSNEHSGLRPIRVLFPFLFKHIRNFAKRFFFNYLLRDFNIATIETFVGLVFFVAGVVFGAYRWIESVETDVPATAGTVMLSALPIVIGIQLLLAAIQYDIQNVPTDPAQHDL